MYIRFLTRRLKKLKKHLEKVEIWNPSVSCLPTRYECGAIADDHIEKLPEMKLEQIMLKKTASGRGCHHRAKKLTE
jgi:hypothetical protein